MREIKFRAWDKINKQMIPHKLLSVGLKNIGNNNQFIYEQFTGLKDKNGTEIYDGDIVEYFQYSQVCSKCAHRDKNVNEVKFNALGATLSSYRIIDPQSDITEIEVIGNIHENPELLENKQCQT